MSVNLHFVAMEACQGATFSFLLQRKLPKRKHQVVITLTSKLEKSRKSLFILSAQFWLDTEVNFGILYFFGDPRNLHKHKMIFYVLFSFPFPNFFLLGFNFFPLKPWLVMVEQQHAQTQYSFILSQQHGISSWKHQDILQEAVTASEQEGLS